MQRGNILKINGRSGLRIGIATVVLCLGLAEIAFGFEEDSTDASVWARELWKEGAGLHLEGDFESAIDRYRRALEFHPTARIHTYLAWSLSRLGRYGEAITHCQKSIDLDPSYPNAYNDLGAYLVAAGRPGEAIPWLRRAIVSPGYCCPHFSYYQLGRALLMQARVDEAAEAFKHAIELRPHYRPAKALLDSIHEKGLKGL